MILYSIPRSLLVNVSQNQPRTISVAIANIAPHDMVNKTFNFSTTCHRRSYIFGSLQHRYVCPSSGHVIVHDCTNKVGVLTTTCPRYHASCSSSSSSGSSSLTDSYKQHPYCELVSFSSDSTICNCQLLPLPLPGDVSSTRRRLDSSSGDVVVTTSLQIAATGEYLVSQIGTTLSASPNLASPDTIEHVYIVISMFASFWVIGVVLLAVGRRAKAHKTKIHEEIEKIPPRTEPAPQNIRQDFMAYIEEAIPSIFRGESNVVKSLKELFKRHKYVALLVYTENLNLLNVTRIVTVQSMLMFILAVTYDLQSPSDDGSCIQWLTEESCTLRKSYLDSTQPYCQWEMTSTDDMGSSFTGYTCSYHDPSATMQVVLTISVIVSLFTAVFLRPIEFFLKLLSAPISNRVVLKTKTSRHTANKGPYNISDEDSTTLTELRRNHLISKVAGVQVRDLSETVISARSAARKTLYSSNRVSSSRPMGEQKHSGSTNSSSSTSPLTRRNQLIGPESNQLSSLTDPAFSMTTLKTALTMAINRQRQRLNGTALDEFDAQWGILRHTDTILARSQSSDLSEVLFISGIFDTIFHDIGTVRNRAIAKVDALRVTTEEQKGLEILHLFIMDLLGKDSSAAMIFKSKLGEDFEETQVVKYDKKVVAAAVLVTANILFTYYTILYGSVRGEAWQMIYLGACLAQFFIEICINESLECLWLHYIVPMLAAKEVMASHAVLVDLVEKFCMADGGQQYMSLETNGAFNAPDYLFVSTNVAKAFPSLMESCIVQSYTTPLPGESAKQWHQSRWQRFLNHIQTPPRDNNRGMNMFLRRSSIVLLTALTLLEYGATAPYLLQKMFVRFCQPFLVSAIVLAFYMVIESPLYIALFFISALLVTLFANRKRLSKLISNHQRSVSADVTPLITITTTDPPIIRVTEIASNDEESSINYSISSETVSSARPDPMGDGSSHHHSSSDEGRSSFYSTPANTDTDVCIRHHTTIDVDLQSSDNSDDSNDDDDDSRHYNF